MGKFDQKMREVERSLAKLTGNKAQAARFRKGLEKKIQQAAVKALPKIVQNLVKSGRAGWANDPELPGFAVLVQRGTGCVLQDPKGKVIKRMPPVTHPVTPGINEGAFIQHLKDAGNELFVPYMYKDENENVTVGIGHLLRNPDMAKAVPFVERGTNKSAHKNHIVNAFNKVKNSPISGQAKHLKFKPLTNIVISEAEAENLAKKDMGQFIQILRSEMNFPEFDTYPEAAKMGLLDMAYTLGVEGTKEKFPNFTLAARHRDWNLAADESDRDVSFSRNQIVFQWFKQAEKQQPFFASVICTKRIDFVFQ